MIKLVIYLTTDARIRQCEVDTNPVEVPAFGGLRQGLEEYGRDWATIWPTDIVMVVEEEGKETDV